VQPASKAIKKISLAALDELNVPFFRAPARSLPPRFLMVSIGDGGNIRAQTCQETHNSQSADPLRLQPPRAVC
jgi:hypothetical protein